MLLIIQKILKNMDSSSEFNFSLNLSSDSLDVSLGDNELSPILRSYSNCSLETMLSQMDTFEIYNIMSLNKNFLRCKEIKI